MYRFVEHYTSYKFLMLYSLLYNRKANTKLMKTGYVAVYYILSYAMYDEICNKIKQEGIIDNMYEERLSNDFDEMCNTPTGIKLAYVNDPIVSMKLLNAFYRKGRFMTTELCDLFATYGYAECLRYASREASWPCGNVTCKIAASRGQLACLKIVLERRCHACGKYFINDCECGEQPIFSNSLLDGRLYKSVVEGCIIRANQPAPPIVKRCCECLKFLNTQKRLNGLEFSEIIHFAIMHAHPDCVKCLYEHCNPGIKINDRMIHEVVCANKLDNFKYLVDTIGVKGMSDGTVDFIMDYRGMNFLEYIYRIEELKDLIIYMFAFHEKIEYLECFNDEPLRTSAYIGAIKGGKLRCFKWLHTHRYPYDESVCMYAALEGKLNILQYAFENGFPFSRHIYSPFVAVQEYIRNVMLRK